MGVIRVDDVTVSFGERLGLDCASFNLKKGEVLALMGQNGAGKSTLVNALTGQIKPMSGSIRVLGVDPYKDREKLAKRWTVMPQSGGLPPGLSVLETVELFSKLHDSDYSVSELLDLVELASVARMEWRKLSGGEQQRLSLAVALCGGQEVMILDEPTSGLDITSRLNLLGILRERAAHGSTIVLTTHIYGDAEGVADRVILLHQGQLVSQADIDKLTHSQKEITFSTVRGLPIETLCKALNRKGGEVSPGQYKIEGLPDSATLGVVTEWLRSNDADVETFSAGPKSLKQVIFDLTEHANEQPEKPLELIHD